MKTRLKTKAETEAVAARTKAAVGEAKARMKVVAKSLEAMPQVGKTVDDYVAEFDGHYRAAQKNLLAAAETYAEALRKHPGKAHRAFATKYPSVSKYTWERFRQIGNHDLVPSAIYVSDTFKTKLLAMPTAIQDRLLTNGKGFNVVRPDGRIGFVKFEDVTARDAATVFDGDRVRSEEEQREWVASHVTELEAYGSKGDAYRVAGKSLVVSRRCTIGVNELKAIVAGMES